MRLVALAWRYLWARPLVAALNLALLALGVAAMSFVVIVGEQVERSVQRDLAGIDLVVGAKGSPMQLILAGVFHIDVPSGNIPLAAINTVREHPLVERVVPGISETTRRSVFSMRLPMELLPTFGRPATQILMRSGAGAPTCRPTASCFGPKMPAIFMSRKPTPVPCSAETWMGGPKPSLWKSFAAPARDSLSHLLAMRMTGSPSAPIRPLTG